MQDSNTSTQELPKRPVNPQDHYSSSDLRRPKPQPDQSQEKLCSFAYWAGLLERHPKTERQSIHTKLYKSHRNLERSGLLISAHPIETDIQPLTLTPKSCLKVLQYNVSKSSDVMIPPFQATLTFEYDILLESNITTSFQTPLNRGGTHLMYIIASSPLDSYLIKDFIQSPPGCRRIISIACACGSLPNQLWLRTRSHQCRCQYQSTKVSNSLYSMACPNGLFGSPEYQKTGQTI